MAAKQTKKKTPGKNSTSWKSGQSGNPKGRPPNPISLTSEIKTLGDQAAPKKILDELRDFWPDLSDKTTLVEALARRDWIRATDLKAGDIMAKEVGERIDGKVPFPLTGTPDADPIRLSFDFSTLTDKQLNVFEKLLSICQTKKQE